MFRDFGFLVFLWFGREVFNSGREIKKKGIGHGSGLFIFLGFATNVATLVTECRGIGVSDFKQISSKHLNAATLGYECRSIEHTDMLSYAHKIFFISYSLTTIIYAI